MSRPAKNQPKKSNTHPDYLSYEDHEHTAHVLMKGEYAHAGHVTLRKYEGKLYVWEGGTFRQIIKDELRATIRNSLAMGEAWVQAPELNSAGQEMHDSSGNVIMTNVVMKYMPSITRVNEVLDALHSFTTIEGSRKGTFLITPDDAYPAGDLLPLKNGLLHMDSRTLLPHTPNYFCQSLSTYEYVPGAKLNFGMKHLHEVYEGREDNIEMLFNWWGLVLLPDMDEHKILMRIGPQRSGKGTESHIISSVIGEDACVYPTLETYDPSSRTFGLESLINKRVAVTQEAQMSNRLDKNALAATLKSLSARDPHTIDRKGTTSLRVRPRDLPRIQLNANDVNSMRDSSGALAGRMAVIHTKVSFKDREDRDRKRRLDVEGAGFINAILDGRDRLMAGARVETPASSRHVARIFEDQASPMIAFIRDRCELGDELYVTRDVFHEAFWRFLKAEHGYKHPQSHGQTITQLKSAVPGMEPYRLPGSRDPERPYVFTGIRVLPEFIPEPRNPKAWAKGGLE